MTEYIIKAGAAKKAQQLSVKPKASHPWRQFNPGWLKSEKLAQQRHATPMVGCVHYQHGKS